MKTKWLFILVFSSFICFSQYKDVVVTEKYKRLYLQEKIHQVSLNFVRIAHLRHPLLGLSPKLKQAAVEQSVYMAKKEDISHDNFNERSIKFQLMGENVIYGYNNAFSALNGWMHSPGHRANILDYEYYRIGVAFIKKVKTYTVYNKKGEVMSIRKTKEVYATQVFR